MSESEYPAILRKAADHIERVGLNKDGGFFEGVDPELVDDLSLLDPELSVDEWFTLEDFYDSYPNYEQVKADLAQRPVTERPCCTLGAIQVAAGGDYPWELGVALRDRLLDARPEGVPAHAWSIPDWSDAPERTVEDVTRLLRETAQELEQKVGGA